MSKQHDFAMGDVVTLKSGGTEMTVTQLYIEDDDSVVVEWFDDDNSLNIRRIETILIKRKSAAQVVH